MRHSIIIPNRDYNTYLRHCIYSIRRSAEICGTDDFEIVVVDQGSQAGPKPLDNARLIVQPRSDYFNKPRAQNAGIEAAQGDVLSFLDADTLVGPKWMECVERLERLGPMALTKLCYRVRLLPEHVLAELDQAAGLDTDRLADYFAAWESWPLAFEGYGEPHVDQSQTALREPVFGKAEFSIRREVLGGLRFDEEFQGRGFEDLWMNRAIWKRDEAGYRAAIVTDPDHALLQIRNPFPVTAEAAELWGPGKQNSKNFRRYYST